MGNSLEGLLHISEVSGEKIKNLESVFSIGQELDVKIVKIEPEARKIGLSLKGVKKTSAQEGQAQEEQADIEASEDIIEEKVDEVEEESI